MADLSDIRSKLGDLHREVPQRAMKAQLALDHIQEGLRELEALGHRFKFGEEHDAPAVLIFPKMLYRDGSPELLVHSRAELEAAIDDGWREHPTDPDVEVGPRPNGHLEAEEPAPVPDPVLSHPMGAQLAAGGPGPENPPVEGSGYEYLTGQPPEQQEGETDEEYAERRGISLEDVQALREQKSPDQTKPE